MAAKFKLMIMLADGSARPTRVGSVANAVPDEHTTATTNEASNRTGTFLPRYPDGTR